MMRIRDDLLQVFKTIGGGPLDLLRNVPSRTAWCTSQDSRFGDQVALKRHLNDGPANLVPLDKGFD